MKKYEIPFNFDIELLNFLDENVDKGWIEFLFLSPFREDSSNARNHVENVKKNGWTYKVPETRSEYTKYIEEIYKRSYNLAVLLQEPTMLSKEKLDYYFKLGIKNFIVNNNDLALKIKNKNSNYQVVASITKTLSAAELAVNDYSMYDKIVLHFPFNRALSRLNDLPKKYNYTFLVNSYCSYSCKVAKDHWYSTYEEALKVICTKYLNKDKLVYIPPEYIKLFEPYAASFKLQGREYPTSILANEIYCYYKTCHNSMAGVIYNRLNPSNQEEYFNAAKDMSVVINPHSY
ncbi:hypothetical protein CLHOM_34570 [Clostridium homopropionicum DSM 5847]|uniref:Peptidase family U32 n=1 Tax=Clostridium homopropionicum DSM 5847 TaxID=1121318 RepID=A0A0L6Z6G9_9CLOT|nr:hypothetical protein [Clostridium homopropionicum]KOA18555.1 hypothetical protein CLHOM_34570 [Clostridium homopropionicum DSM 5847]SFF64892.1 hypothetical protein SAMN04488501_10122 [Clostridium homopropionicum]